MTSGEFVSAIIDLALALREARSAAELAAAEVGDSGSCNFDYPYLLAEGLPIEVMRRAAEPAGVTWSLRLARDYPMIGRHYELRLVRGMAGRRTAMAEAATRCLKARGYKAGTFYMVD